MHDYMNFPSLSAVFPHLRYVDSQNRGYLDRKKLVSITFGSTTIKLNLFVFTLIGIILIVTFALKHLLLIFDMIESFFARKRYYNTLLHNYDHTNVWLWPSVLSIIPYAIEKFRLNIRCYFLGYKS
jgi:hypothetical protein